MSGSETDVAVRLVRTLAIEAPHPHASKARRRP